MLDCLAHRWHHSPLASMIAMFTAACVIGSAVDTWDARPFWPEFLLQIAVLFAPAAILYGLLALAIAIRRR